MFELRDYQERLSTEACTILKKYNIVYFAVEVRVGKSLMALNTAKLYGAKNVLFLTKKKAISSIESDYNNFGYSDVFEITIVNNESMHKVEGYFDLVIHDESHRFGSFPKPSKGAKDFKSKFSHLPLIMLSGTIHPESFSQVYHQFWVSKYSPFEEKTFYKWADKYVKKKQVNFGYGMVNDYSVADKEKIYRVIDKYVLTFTQEQSGFKSKVNEHFLTVPMKPITYKLCDTLKKDLVIIGKEKNVVADTAVKLMQKLHQLYSGTLKHDDESRQIIDDSKAIFIRDYFKGKKIGIFYKFIAELELLKEVFGDDLTTDVEEFDNSNKNIALQFVSGREGISLRNADCLVAYNIDFSATTYFQFKDRMTTKERLVNDLYWIFSENGIEKKIYSQVSKKKNFTSSVFKKEYNVKFPKKDNKRI